jgi:EAL domain-containing protein (putative c-di-GMP-specific phosphodiesterase class I)
MKNEMRYEAKLRMALEQSTLNLVFEPQLDAQSGRIGGLDCILRWTDADLGEVPEAQALQTAETAGMIRELTWWIFNNALRQGRVRAGRAGVALEGSFRERTVAARFSGICRRALRT